MKMLRFETGDITSYPIFCQQVSSGGECTELMKKYPKVCEEYKQLCMTENMLGKIQMTTIESGINRSICVNLFAQEKTGSDKRYTNYEAFMKCLETLAEELWFSAAGFYNTIAFPYKIGFEAGSNWAVILEMIKEFSDKIKIDTVIVSKE